MRPPRFRRPRKRGPQFWVSGAPGGPQRGRRWGADTLRNTLQRKISYLSTTSEYREWRNLYGTPSRYARGLTGVVTTPLTPSLRSHSSGTGSLVLRPHSPVLRPHSPGPLPVPRPHSPGPFPVPRPHFPGPTPPSPVPTPRDPSPSSVVGENRTHPRRGCPSYLVGPGQGYPDVTTPLDPWDTSAGPVTPTRPVCPGPRPPPRPPRRPPAPQSG